jgi:hypothetical protein
MWHSLRSPTATNLFESLASRLRWLPHCLPLDQTDPFCPLSFRLLFLFSLAGILLESSYNAVPVIGLLVITFRAPGAFVVDKVKPG